MLCMIRYINSNSYKLPFRIKTDYHRPCASNEKKRINKISKLRVRARDGSYHVPPSRLNGLLCYFSVILLGDKLSEKTTSFVGKTFNCQCETERHSGYIEMQEERRVELESVSINLPLITQIYTCTVHVLGLRWWKNVCFGVGGLSSDGDGAVKQSMHMVQQWPTHSIFVI